MSSDSKKLERDPLEIQKTFSIHILSIVRDIRTVFQNSELTLVTPNPRPPTENLQTLWMLRNEILELGEKTRAITVDTWTLLGESKVPKDAFNKALLSKMKDKFDNRTGSLNALGHDLIFKSLIPYLNNTLNNK